MIGYDYSVRLENPSYAHFLALSLALHLATVPFLWRKPISQTPSFDQISVSFLPEERTGERENAPVAAPLRAENRRKAARAKTTRKTVISRRPDSRRSVTPPKPRPAPPPEALSAKSDAPAVSAPPSRIEQHSPPENIQAPVQENEALASRPPVAAEASIFKQEAPQAPPSRKELLPERRDLIGTQRAIPLNTSDARYAPYTQTVKQWIEARWEYPDLAKHYGLQGRVVVEFTILPDGHIELLSLVRSSGSKLLDEEAVRAIKAAVPFKPFPRSIRESRLRIIAGFVYADRRLRVSDR